jgi:hypothetical protein
MRIAALVTAACLALGVAACGGAAEETATTAPETTATGALPTFEDLRQSYVETCSETGDAKTCECTFDYLEKNSTVEEVAQAGFDAEKGKQPKVLQDALEACS